MTERTKQEIGKASKARGKRAELDPSYKHLDFQKLEERPSIVARSERQMSWVYLEYIVSVKLLRD